MILREFLGDFWGRSGAMAFGRPGETTELLDDLGDIFSDILAEIFEAKSPTELFEEALKTGITCSSSFCV